MNHILQIRIQDVLEEKPCTAHGGACPPGGRALTARVPTEQWGGQEWALDTMFTEVQPKQSFRTGKVRVLPDFWRVTKETDTLYPPNTASTGH